MAKNPKTTKLINSVLVILTEAGMLGMVVVAPNAIQALAPILKKLEKNQKKRDQLAYYISRSRLIETRTLRGGKLAVTISPKAHKRLQKALFTSVDLEIPKKWDGKWRIVMFDIAEKHKVLRDTLSERVQNIGMLPLQDSVYVYPYDVSPLMQAIHLQYPYAMRYVLKFEATDIDGAEQLKKTFRL